MPTAAAMPPALVVCVLVVAGVAATPGVAVGAPLTVTAPQGPAAGETTLALDRPARRLIQQRLRIDGFARNAAGTNTEPAPRPAPGSGNAQLTPDILVDRHLVRAERLLADGDPTAALQTMNEILALRQAHDVVLADDFDFEYAQVAFAAGRTQTAITSLNEYLVTVGREGELYREVLELLDSAEVRLAEAERRRAETERRRTARSPPGHVFRDCETCPDMAVLPGSAVALGHYEVTAGEHRAFASATGGGVGSGCSGLSDGNDGARSWPNPGPADGSPSRDVRELERGSGVCVLADRDDGDRLSSTHVRDIRGSGGESSAWVQLLQYGGDCPVGNYGGNRLGLSDLLGNVAERRRPAP